MTRPMPGPPECCYCRFGNATCQECETRGYPYSWGLCPGCELHNGRDLGAYKRLKDAECAAEYWRAVANLLAAPPHSSEMLSAREKKRVCANFATHPHALEES